MKTERRELLELLAELSNLYPDMRLGQLLTWFAGAARGPKIESIYDAEDAELISIMRAHLDEKRSDQKAPAARN